VQVIPYVSAGRIEGLNRLGVFTLYDLIRHYPQRYNDFGDVTPIALVPIGEKATVLGRVYEVKVKPIRPRMTIIEVTLTDDSGMCYLSFFNQPWLAKQVAAGMMLVSQGIMEHNYGFRRMSSPVITVLDKDQSDSAPSAGIQPVYAANSGISQGWVKRFVNEALQKTKDMLDPLPAHLRLKHGLADRRFAFWQIHHPSSMEDYRKARERLAFDEVFTLQLYLLRRKQSNQAMPSGQAINVQGKAVQGLLEALPFKLTNDQQKAVQEIFADLARTVPMSRLLMGDVGSGKTVVALHALLATADSGRQAAMMAPTEVLAIQYASQLGPYLDRLQVRWAMLSSSTGNIERQGILSGLASGEIKVVFGTHALIEPDVGFADLALVVIDEQHRFGVNQREALRLKGQGVHYLTMTATPIPRSQALMIYGDLDVSEIRSRPRAMAQITTRLLDRQQVGVAYDAIRAAVARGEQAYIVCPLIGQAYESPPDGSEPDHGPEEELLTEYMDHEENLRAAKQEHDFLSQQVFPENRVGLMTSKLPAAEKRQVMEDFRAGLINVLVSTTVIEVGVDVPNATVMVILDADRFGLSQLHQLRGRVGRGDKDGEAYLVSGTNSEDALKRLRILEKSSNGFDLAEQDLMIRQEGDVLGIRQHGKARLRLVQVVRDRKIIEAANKEAAALLDRDPGLSEPEHAVLAWEFKMLTADWD